MNDQRAGRDFLGDPAEAHQVADAVQHGGLLDGAGDLVARTALQLAHHEVAAFLGDAGPGREVIVVGIDAVTAIDQRADAAAQGMAQHDDMLDVEAAHGVLDSGRGAVMAPVGRDLRRRHHGRHVAHGENIAGLGLGQNAGIDAGIGAAHDQDLGRLALGRQLLEKVEMLSVIA